MSKKIEIISDINSRVAIEEFFLVIELSMEIIYPKCGIFMTMKRKIDVEKTEVQLKSDVYSFYHENRELLYSNTDVMLNGLVRINSNKEERLLANSESGDINDISLLQLFQSKDVIKELGGLAENSIKNQKNKNEFTYRLKENIYRMGGWLSCINLFPLALKLWREVLLEESKRLLDCLEKEDIPQGNYRVKVLVLKSLIEAAGINPSRQGDKQLFIAKILGTTQMNVKDIFSDLRNEENYEIIKDQSEEAIQICEYLKNKNDENSNTAIKRMIENISLAGTAEYKNIK